MIQVQLSSKRWHKQLLFICLPPGVDCGRFISAQYHTMPVGEYELLVFLFFIFLATAFLGIGYRGLRAFFLCKAQNK